MALVDGPLAEPLASNRIADWVAGDTRQFLRTLNVALLEAGDQVTDAYFTLKTSPFLSDASAVLQIHVVQIPSVYGQVGVPIGGIQSITVNISGNLTANVNPGQVYYYEIKFLTFGGAVWSAEDGQVQFIARIGDVIGGGPVLPLTQGIPSFRGYAVGPPPLSSLQIYYTGDWIRNLQPTSGSPSGWVCINGGTPGTWLDFAIVGDSPGPIGVPLPASGFARYWGFQNAFPPLLDSSPVQADWLLNLSPVAGAPKGWVYTGTLWVTDSNVADSLSVPLAGADPSLNAPPTFWGFAYGPPISGVYNWGDWSRNILPAPGTASGWVCVAAGSPGTWMSDGFVGSD